MIRGKRHGPTYALRKRRSSGDAAQNTEEIATVSCSHFDFSLAVVWGEAAMLGRHNYGRATDSLWIEEETNIQIEQSKTRSHLVLRCLRQ
jgi:hypothetical protein